MQRWADNQMLRPVWVYTCLARVPPLILGLHLVACGSLPLYFFPVIPQPLSAEQTAKWQRPYGHRRLSELKFYKATLGGDK